MLWSEHDTEKAIAHNRASAEQELIERMLPDIKSQAHGEITYHCKLVSHPRLGKSMKAYIAIDSDNQILGYISSFNSMRAYNSPLMLIGGIDTTGKITKIDVLLSKETPGIGDKVERSRSNYLAQFDGKTLDNAKWDVKKFNGDFDYFTGATITSRAVVLGARDFLTALQELNLSAAPDCPESK